MTKEKESEKKKKVSFAMRAHRGWQRARCPFAIAAIGILIAAFGFAAVWHGYNLYRFGARGMAGNRIFYDEFHVKRHLVDGRNVRGENKYHIVSGYHDFRRMLERAGFVFHIHREGRLRPGMLDGFDIYFVGEQTPQATEMNEEERAVIFDFIKNGGGMWATIEHTNVHGITKLLNPFMEGTDIRARYDSICVDNNTKNSRDWIALNSFTEHPLTEGLDNVYFFYGCSLDTSFGVGFSKKESWSDAWNPDNPPTHNGNNSYDADELRGPLTGLAARTFGNGKIAVICDHNPFSNPSFYMGSNQQLALNAMNWLGKSRPNPSIYRLSFSGLCALLLYLVVWRFRIMRIRWFGVIWTAGLLSAVAFLAYQQYEQQVFRILFAEVNNPDVTTRTKENRDIWSFYQDIQKSEEVSVWMKEKILPGYDTLGLVAPKEKYSKSQLETIDSYLNQGKTVIYLATAGSLRSEAGRQLKSRFGVDVTVTSQARRGPKRREFELKGSERIRRDVGKVNVHRNIPLTRLTGDGWRVVLTAFKDSDSFDLIAEKQIGVGRVVLISPLEFFSKRNRKRRKCGLCLVDLITNTFEWVANHQS